MGIVQDITHVHNNIYLSFKCPDPLAIIIMCV